MASESQSTGKKRSKAFYRKSAYGGNKKHCTGTNILEPGIRGFLVMCNHDERSAVRESYNILNEYADNLYGPDKNAGLHHPQEDEAGTEDDEECDDVEKALKKEVEGLKKAAGSSQKRFQNVATKAKNCVFIRTSLANPVEVIVHVMEDIAEKHLKRARYAARIIPVLGTCRANTKDIAKLASDILTPVFSKESDSTPSSFTVLFKMRNNQGTACGRESVIPAITKIVKDINAEVKFSWTDFSTAILVEVVCTVCCIGVAPDYTRLRKYNLQELTQGPKSCAPPAPQPSKEESDVVEKNDVVTENIIMTESEDTKGETKLDILKDGVTEKFSEPGKENGSNEKDSVKSEEKEKIVVEERIVCDNEDTSVSKNEASPDHVKCVGSEERSAESNS